MISYIKGEIADITEDTVVIEANQIGYLIRIPMSSAASLPGVGNEVKIYTYMHVREDAINLFGFLSKDDLNVFKLLLLVNGIGPKGALGILSAITPDDLRLAVLSDDVKAISKAPGIGMKTAQKLIIELKDKLKIEDTFISHTSVAVPSEGLNDIRNEAVQALTALGYSATEALKAVRQTDGDLTDVESILKAALKKISFL